MKKTTSQHEIPSVTDILEFNNFALECLSKMTKKDMKGVEVLDWHISKNEPSFCQFSIYPSDKVFTVKFTVENIIDTVGEHPRAVDVFGSNGEWVVEVENYNPVNHPANDDTSDVSLWDFVESGEVDKEDMVIDMLSNMASEALKEKGGARYFEMSERIGLIELRLAA